MKINGIILQKISRIDEILFELASLGKVTGDDLRNDWRTWRAIERNLQILCEVMVDVCQRLLSLFGDSPAATATNAVELCAKKGVLLSAVEYVDAIRFRNFIVHRYDSIDPDIIAKVLNEKLSIFDSFKKEILAYVTESDLSR
jgi:uncharacterized protein YutE (UPF0331/DUF86 family)